MNELITPCPFCGGDANIFEFANGWSVDCDNDECVTQPTLANMFHKKEQAVTAWNTRVRESELQSQIDALENTVHKYKYGYGSAAIKGEKS